MIARQAAVYVARWQNTLQKKTSKGDVKNLFWPRKIWPVTAVPLAYLQVLAYHFGREI